MARWRGTRDAAVYALVCEGTRQRYFYNRSSGDVLLNADTLAHIEALIAQEGADV